MLVHAGASGLRCADRREGLDLVPGDAGCLSDGGLGQAQVEHGGDAGGALAVGEGFALVVGDDLLADASGLAGVVGSVLLGADDDGHAGPVRGAGGEKSALSIGDQDGAVIPAFGQDRVQDTVFCDGLDKLRCRVEVDLVADVVTDLEGGGIDGEQFGGGRCGHDGLSPTVRESESGQVATVPTHSFLGR